MNIKFIHLQLIEYIKIHLFKLSFIIISYIQSYIHIFGENVLLQILVLEN